MNKKRFIFGLFVVVLILLVAGIFLLKSDTQKTYSAIIYPEAESYVKALLSGTVKDVYVEPKAQVSRGQVLAVIESTVKSDEKTSKESPKVNLSQIKSRLDRAEENYKNAAMMYKDGVITQEDYDKRLTDLKNAQDAYKTAVSKSKTIVVEPQKKKLVTMNVFSPIDGIVDSSFVKKGDSVNSGDNMMLITMNTKKVTAYVDKKALSKIKAGQSVLISVPGYEDKKFNGIVDYTDKNPVTVADISEPVYPVSISFDSKIDTSKFSPVGNVAVVFMNGDKAWF